MDENGIGSVIVNWDFSLGENGDKDILVVGKQENRQLTIINAFIGKKAREIYKLLTTQQTKN